MIKALTRTSLPTGAGGDRTKQFHFISVLTGHQMVSIHVARVHSMFCWQEVLSGKRLMDGSRHLHILGGGRGRFHMDEQMRMLLITGFGQVNLVSRPDRTAFDTEMGFWIIGRGNQERRRRNILVRAPSNHSVL